MSVKFSTLILQVNLSCVQCNRKIQKYLCKIQDRENIRSITYDDKNNKVIISGPFDPHYLKSKLNPKPGELIEDVQIPPPPPPPPPPEKKPDPPPEKKPDQKKSDPPPEKKPERAEKATAEWPPVPVCCTRPCYVGMFGGLKCATCGMVYTWTNQGPPPVVFYNQPPVPRPYYYDGYGYGGYGPFGCGCGCGHPKTCQFICEDNSSQCAIM